MKELLSLIEDAAQTLRGVVKPTPTVYSASLSSIHGREIYLKLENLQKTGSFKVRGAYNKIASLSGDERKRGVIAASSGNHAQGVAWAAGLCNVKSTVVMPESSAIIKHVAARGYGAEVVFHGKTFSEAYGHALRVSAENGMAFIPPFDDLLVIAGQGTIGLEMLADLPDVDTVVVPVGGGGLISGISVLLKERMPSVKVMGVEAGRESSYRASVQAGRPVEVAKGPGMADGIAVKRLGEKTFPIMRRYVDDVVMVGEDSIAAAILQLIERKKLIVEGAGATTLAAVMEGKLPEASKKVLLLLSGGNIDVTTLDRVIRTGLIKEGRVIRLAVVLPDTPVALASLTTGLAAMKANTLHASHMRDAADVAFGNAVVELALEVEDRGHGERVIEGLRVKGYSVETLSHMP